MRPINLSFVLIIFLLVACNNDKLYVPKPRLYPKINYPQKTYQLFAADYCPMSFEYPTYAVIEQDTSFFDQNPVHPCWFDIIFPDFNGRIHCSYYEISEENTLDALVKDAFTLTGKHNIKANYRDEMVIIKPNEVSGVVFDVSGPVASPTQFYLTDSTQHFLRASLYFNNQINTDSMAPVYEFIKQDIAALIEGFSWK